MKESHDLCKIRLFKSSSDYCFSVCKVLVLLESQFSRLYMLVWKGFVIVGDIIFHFLILSINFKLTQTLPEYYYIFESVMSSR